MWTVSVNDVWRYSKGNLTAIVVDFNDGAFVTIYNSVSKFTQATFYGQLDDAKAWAKAYIDLENL